MNPETSFTLDEAVSEVLISLTGIDLSYMPETDRYRVITNQLNRALRLMALEKEWSYFSDVESLGPVIENQRTYDIRPTRRVRIVNDDAVRLVDEHDHALVWAYFLPRDALHKYAHRSGLWACNTRNRLEFSRPPVQHEIGLDIQLPVMREPTMIRLPDHVDGEPQPVPDEIRNQPVDFPYPDVVCMRAAYLYAQTDPVMQPRVQTLEAQYKDLMYQIIERDDRNTEAPYINGFVLPVSSGLSEPLVQAHGHPHSDVHWS